MAIITDYTSLLSNVSDYLGDTSKVASYPTYVQMFESHANRKLQVREQQVSTSLTLTAGSSPLPADYLNWRSVLWTGVTPYKELKWIDPAYLDAISPVQTSGNPQYFLIRGTTISVRRSVSTSPLQFDYFATIPALTALAPTNWLLLDSPDVYLAGVLVEAARMGEFVENVLVWKATRDEMLKDIQDAYDATQGELASSLRQDCYF